MSLINDAIKKANQANKERKPESATDPTPTAGMQTAAATRTAAADASGMTGMFLILGVVVFVLLGGLLLMMAMKQNPAETQAAAENVQPVVVPDSTPIPGRVIPPPAASVPVTSSESIATEQTVVEVAAVAVTTAPTQPEATPPVPVPVPAPAPVPTGPREFPEMRLQGIYYRLKSPSVMINGKTLWIGDLIEDAKVTDIQRQTVTLELDGNTKVLRLQ